MLLCSWGDSFVGRGGWDCTRFAEKQANREHSSTPSGIEDGSHYHDGAKTVMGSAFEGSSFDRFAHSGHVHSLFASGLKVGCCCSDALKFMAN
jgi:hypothetical protein